MKDMESILNIFRTEVTTASQAFFAWKTIHNMAASDKEMYKSINDNALSWKIITHSLQTTYFITLGRIFDVEGKAFSIHAFLRACIDNIDQFGKKALRHRKIKSLSGEEPTWLNEYIENAYVPVNGDFLMLKGETSKRQKEYEAIYRPIRNEIIAHKDKQRIDTVDELFGQTNIGQIEELLQFLYQVEQIVCNLLFDGRLHKIGDLSFNKEDYVRRDIESMLQKLKTQHK